MKNYFLISCGSSSFIEGKEEIERTGVMPAQADNLGILYQHILYHFDGITEIKNFLLQQYEEEKNVIAIEISPEMLENFQKGQKRSYDNGKLKQTFILFLDKYDVFDVYNCNFFEIIV